MIPYMHTSGQCPLIKSAETKFYSLEGDNKPASRNEVDELDLKKAELRKAAKGFEAIFIRQLMKTMRASIPGEGMFGGGSSGEIYGDMMDTALADVGSEKSMFGIGDVLYRRLVKNLEMRYGETAQENIKNADSINN